MLACKLLGEAVIMDSNTNLSELPLPDLRRGRLPQSGPKRRRLPKMHLSSREDPRRPAVGTLTRTRTLILAALRVWELKQGIRS